MSRILLPSTGPNDWRRLLADPSLHWAIGRSARTLANAWEAADGLPPEIHNALAAIHPEPRLLLAIPEHKTPLPGGRRESQSDIFALIGSDNGLIAATIEGKVDEPFGPRVADWNPDGSPGKRERFDYLCRILGINSCPPDLHYQLLHRTASALIEAERYGTPHAAMVVHSFSPDRRWFDAYAKFVEVLAGPVDATRPQRLSMPDDRSLTLAWCSGSPSFLLC